MIAIIDYKTANLGSIVNILKHIGARAFVADKPEMLADASHVVLPGIGHFDECARNLRAAGFVDALHEQVLEQNKPLLGICVGAQLLTLGSEEGNEPGLGWVDGETLRFPEAEDFSYKVPHMGWNQVAVSRQHPLFDGYAEIPRFYFVHSYYMRCKHADAELGKTHHGIDFASVIGRDNFAGVQFHPEKSHRFGMHILRNFAAMGEQRKGD